MVIGTLLKLYREYKRLGVRGLSKHVGVSHGTISRIERGEEINAETMLKLIVWVFSKEQ